MKKFLIFALACATIAPAALAASSPWDGTWRLDAAKSHFTGTTFTYSKTANGMWNVAAGNVTYDFGTDGKPYKTIDADDTVTAKPEGTHAINFTYKFKGKVVSETHETLSADGKTITDLTTDFRPDGTTGKSTSVNARVSGGPGFAGTWKSTQVHQSSPDTWMMSSPSAGVIKWEIPAYKETLEGKTDGSDLAIHGPTVSPDMTISLKAASPNQLNYWIKLKGKVLGEGTMTLSNNGRTMTNVSWDPGKADEKTTGVYNKQ